ncbi:endonuclease III domain-containing protein [Spiribacter pallidus]|jgi:endonuclease-3 related protein|uniref:Endonuclease n=1 Tax=Spiribacter pallidus TaxID=1987936 RepID=A0ABV3TBQ6_9GAMM
MAKDAVHKAHQRLRAHFGERQQWWPAQTAFEVLVGAVLTQNTAWTNVERAMARLLERDWLSAPAIIEAPEAALAECLRPSGYYNVKARRLRAACERWIELGEENGLRAMAPEAAREALLAVNGLGPESVDDVLLYGLQQPVFVVDAYTHRIFHRMGLAPARYHYHRLQAFFHERLPADARLFGEYHALIIELGKGFCRPRQPRCSACPLQSICQTGRSVT